ncbi:MAG TPA: hypothetical protein VK633_06395 [Verrucomicrobiae bacterium]|nr:hypothetical protein [Verrucomicrobiae bacterium]
MAELLVKAVDATNPDPMKDARGCYKRGMPVVVFDDGHEWGDQENLPTFALLKFPLIGKNALLKYTQKWEGNRRRRWQIRWVDLPLAARQKLATAGTLTIKATTAYPGPFDYTWAAVKSFFRNLETNTDETEDV